MSRLTQCCRFLQPSPVRKGCQRRCPWRAGESRSVYRGVRAIPWIVQVQIGVSSTHVFLELRLFCAFQAWLFVYVAFFSRAGMRRSLSCCSLRSSASMRALQRPHRSRSFPYAHAWQYKTLCRDCRPTPPLISPNVPVFPVLPQKGDTRHIMIGVLVSLDNLRSRQLYARLRAAHNLTRPSGVLQILPLEEWRGASAFCQMTTCMCEL